ncbi:glycosyltransferase family 2 protein [Curtobacterium sp. MCBD17_030]|uniref:glycosyltransferase family 2 protein n=1 Tax=Curtobacterium sp. MCBD17_030 TaxID=2175649 RepID=UPI000D8BC310|nr:glycosyltransferase family 2 protein [Curtobacterium sp. MCBD17_030]PYY31838.1 hypothetical protein DEI89_15325 [Curtobacterium sp. MCBD17_030]
MTAHNDRESIGESLQSVAAQTSSGFKFLVVDDASEDGTPDLLEVFAAEHPHTSLVLLPTNVGVAAARNLAVRAVDTPYVLFVDSDDVLRDDAVSVYLPHLASASADIVVSRAVSQSRTNLSQWIVVDHHEQVGALSARDCLRAVARAQLHGYLWNKVLRTSLVRAAPFPDLSSQSDLAGVAGFLALAEVVVMIPEVTYEYRLRAGSITNSKAQLPANIYACLAAVESAFETKAMTHSHMADLQFARIWFRLRALHAAMALRDEAELRRARGALLRGISLTKLVAVWRLDRRLGMMATVAALSPSVYASAYRFLKRRREFRH